MGLLKNLYGGGVDGGQLRRGEIGAKALDHVLLSLELVLKLRQLLRRLADLLDGLGVGEGLFFIGPWVEDFVLGVSGR